jgi:HEAT repeat protein
MGANAKQALPALESLVKGGDAKVREAAQQAIKAIRK